MKAGVAVAAIILALVMTGVKAKKMDLQLGLGISKQNPRGLRQDLLEWIPGDGGSKQGGYWCWNPALQDFGM